MSDVEIRAEMEDLFTTIGPNFFSPIESWTRDEAIDLLEYWMAPEQVKARELQALQEKYFSDWTEYVYDLVCRLEVELSYLRTPSKYELMAQQAGYYA
jgi:hypothetical protein